ncbi:Asp23/Gls24 family envelope stress response protein [Clostridiaceae bacterium M8S5]|nr:Asp23/Gls24 family envelope stress response protein [Clostridiaceae bacterium M8S5]
MKVFALVGKSGTGKSYKAMLVAKKHNIQYIIDDGLLIKGNKIITGVSAKSESTKISATKRAVFLDEDHKVSVLDALRIQHPKKLLILGTSIKMVNKIAAALHLDKIDEFIDINEISTKEELQAAHNCRFKEGKHVIPVPTFEIKKDFSGYFIDKLKIFKKKGKINEQYIEKSVVRPTYSYLGRYTISQNVLKNLIRIACTKIDEVDKYGNIRVLSKAGSIAIKLDVILYYGMNISKIIETLQKQIIKEIEQMTSLNILSVDVNIKKLNINKIK